MPSLGRRYPPICWRQDWGGGGNQEGSNERLCHINFGGGPNPGLTLGVTFAKKTVLLGRRGDGLAWICRTDLPTPKPALNPFSHRLAKRRTQAG